MDLNQYTVYEELMRESRAIIGDQPYPREPYGERPRKLRQPRQVMSISEFEKNYYWLRKKRNEYVFDL